MKSNTKYSYLLYWICNDQRHSKYVKINNVNSLYLIFSKVNGYFEEINKNKYLTLVPTNESKEVIKNYEELRSEIRHLIISITESNLIRMMSYLSVT